MKVELTLEQLRRPLGSNITDPEARRFFSRVGPVNFLGDDDDEGFGIPDFAALNREFDEYERGLPARIIERARRRKGKLP